MMIFSHLSTNANIFTRGVPIYRIGNISAADMAKFSISGIGIF